MEARYTSIWFSFSELSGFQKCLPELVRYAKTATWILPTYIFMWAHQTAAPTLDAALGSNDYVPICLFLIRTDRTEIETGLIAGDTSLSIDELQMGYILICEILDRHQEVIDIDVGEFLFALGLSNSVILCVHDFASPLLLNASNSSAKRNHIANHFDQWSALC
jgi:hypothetical protein